MESLASDRDMVDSMEHGLVQTGFVDSDFEESTRAPAVPRKLDSIDPSLSTVSRVYCGMVRPSGGAVSSAELQQFIDDTVSQIFPDGFTALAASGGWRDLVTGHTTQEPSTIFEVAHGAQDKSRVIDLAKAYKARFGQQSVMVASMPVATQFI